MANQAINALQVSYAKSWAGLTTDNHLFAIYQNEPQLASDIVTEVFNKMGYSGLDNFLSKFPVKIMDHDGEYEWMLKGDDRKAIKIVGYSAAGSTSEVRPGLNQSIFQITVEEKWFNQSDVLQFDDKEYTVRIVSEGYADGTNWVYDVQTMDPSPNSFIPTSLLTAGRKVSKFYNAVTNTLNDEYSQPQFTSHFKMRNIFSTLSKEQIVPGNMHDRPLLIKMTADGKTFTTWTRWQDIVTDYQWKKEKANNLMFSKINLRSDGSTANRGRNGFSIKQGAGLRQQIAPSYKFYFNTLTLDYLFEVALNLSINILPEDQREFLILTGERGMIDFHKLIEDKVHIFQPLDSKRVLGSGQNMGFGGQYKMFLGPQGIKYTIAHMPEYDDTIDNRLPHPDGGYVENRRMTIMNIGTTDGQPNIQKVMPRGSEKKWYIPGSVDPTRGPQNGGMGASKVDGYSIHYMTSQGIMLRNPLSAAELIPNVAY